MKSEELPSQENEGPSIPKPVRTSAATGTSFAGSEPPPADLSREIARILPHSPRERVTCRRIDGNRYRCNWWMPQDTENYDNPCMTGLTVTTHRVVKSEVLRITKTADGYVIEQRSQSGARLPRLIKAVGEPL